MFEWRFWLIASLWVIWEAYWIISARGLKRPTSSEPLSSRLPVIIGLALSIALLLVPNWFGSFIGGDITQHDDLSYFGGLVIALAGMAIAFWARHTLGRNWSGRVTIKEDHELVTAGPYRWVRHPIYTGALLIVTGSALALGRFGGLLSIAIMTTIFLHKIRMEERMLSEYFGNQYEEYRRRTDALIPSLW